MEYLNGERKPKIFLHYRRRIGVLGRYLKSLEQCAGLCLWSNKLSHTDNAAQFACITNRNILQMTAAKRRYYEPRSKGNNPALSNSIAKRKPKAKNPVLMCEFLLNTVWRVLYGISESVPGNILRNGRDLKVATPSFFMLNLCPI